jgi:putative thioredoxin
MKAEFDFQRDVVERSRELPVLVDFWAEWCAPCRQLTPLLEGFAKTGRVELAKVNVEEYPDLAAELDVSSIPAVKLFVDGELVDGFVGALPERELTRWLDEKLPPPSHRHLAEAVDALRAGNQQLAREALERAVAEDERAWEARVLLARLNFRADPAKALALVATVPANDPAYDQVEALQTLARLLELTKSGVPSDAGPLASDWEGYLRGASAFAAGQDAAALGEWIGMLARRRDVDDGGPKRAALALFRLLGDESDVTREYRRRFSSALF